MKLCLFAVVLIAASIVVLNTDVSDGSTEGIIIEGDLTDTARFYVTDEYNLFIEGTGEVALDGDLFKTFVKSIR